MVAESADMKRWLASLFFLAACAPEPSPLPPATSPAAAAAIPEGRTPEERRELFQAALSLHEGGDSISAERLFSALVGVSPGLRRPPPLRRACGEGGAAGGCGRGGWERAEGARGGPPPPPPPPGPEGCP